MSTVCFSPCSGYNRQLPDKAVHDIFTALALADEIRPGMRVVLKPNLLAGRSPDKAATTHPLFVRAVICQLRELGVRDITIADSPGGPFYAANLKSVYSAGGYRALADMAVLNEDTGFSDVAADPCFTVRNFHIINAVQNADYLINLPKLKTHSLTGMSGGIKNLFGCIPGLEKPEFHYRFPKTDDFSAMLLELAQTVAPNVTIIDAVEMMEGNGPNMGTPRNFGWCMGSKDIFSLDWAAACSMGLAPETIPMLRLARDQGLIRPDEIIYYEGRIPRPVAVKKPDTIDENYLNGIPRFLRRPVGAVAKACLKPMPSVIGSRCIGCGKCAESCPQHIISISSGTNRHACIRDKKRCISCFCCQEMCPAHAIRVRRFFKMK